MPSEDFPQSQRLLAAGRWRDAKPLLEGLAMHTDCDPAVLRQLAEIALHEGDAPRALRHLARVDLASDTEAAFLAAQAEAASGQLAAARTRLLELRARLARPSAMVALHLGAVLERMGDRAGAIEALRDATSSDPPLTAAYKNLAALLVLDGRQEEAHAALRHAVTVFPRDAGLWVRLARVESTLGRAEESRAALTRAEEAGPANVTLWREVAQIHAEYWRFEQADEALSRAAALDPGDPDTEALRAVVKQELGDTQGALAALASARPRGADDLRIVLGERLLLPQVYEDAADVLRWRERYARGMQACLDEIDRWDPVADRVFDLNRNNFLLAYQGEDDRELQRGYSRLLAHLAGIAHPEWRAPRPRRFDGRRRLRVGFVSSIFRDCTAGRYFERWITALDAERFERFVYHTAPLTDAFTQRIAAASEHFEVMRTGAREIAARLAADELDAIVHPEVGMTPSSYMLAALRLAPVQLAGWGHPVTTGSDAIDYYVTCGAMEPADAAEHYVERLIRLPGPGVDYAMPEAGKAIDRAQLGIGADRHVYVCPQSLFKIHPDMDALLADVLACDPQGVLLLFQAMSPGVTHKLSLRLQRALASRGLSPQGQVKFLPRMGGAGFRGVLAMADVVLDTVRWSGGNTSLDAFAAGTPVVTWPGRFMRARQTAGMLDMMGLAGLAAGSADEYAQLAVATATDRDRNAFLRDAIREGREALFDRHEPIEAFAQALLQAARAGT